LNRVYSRRVTERREKRRAAESHDDRRCKQFRRRVNPANVSPPLRAAGEFAAGAGLGDQLLDQSEILQA
jgi:hypothetical protein